MPRFLFLLLIAVSGLCFSASEEDPWRAYLDASVGNPIYYLYQELLHEPIRIDSSTRAIDLGAGSGEVDLDLAAKGCYVTAVDTSPRSGEIINQRMQHMHAHYDFQRTDFNTLSWKGNYDLVFSFFSLPFAPKEELPALLVQISHHTNPGARLVFSFFGYEHDFVKRKIAYGIAEDELSRLLQEQGFSISYFLQRQFDRTDERNGLVHWDVLDVIAIKHALEQ